MERVYRLTNGVVIPMPEAIDVPYYDSDEALPERHGDYRLEQYSPTRAEEPVPEDVPTTVAEDGEEDLEKLWRDHGGEG